MVIPPSIPEDDPKSDQISGRIINRQTTLNKEDQDIQQKTIQ